MSELAHGKWSGPKDQPGIIQRLRERRPVEGGGVNRLGSWQFARDLGFVLQVPVASVVGKQSHVVGPGEVPKNIVGANFAACVDWQQFARFDPENSQGVTRKSLRSSRGPDSGLPVSAG